MDVRVAEVKAEVQIKTVVTKDVDGGSSFDRCIAESSNFTTHFKLIKDNLELFYRPSIVESVILTVTIMLL